MIDVVDFFALCAEEEDGSNTSLSNFLSTCSRSSDRVQRDATAVAGSFRLTEANWTISIAMIAAAI